MKIQTPLDINQLRPGKARLTSIAFASELLVASLLASTLMAPAFAGPLPLVQQPAGTGGREPAPNVIISIDDSGSMGGAVGGGNPSSKMVVLRAALISQFGDPNANPPTKGRIEDDRIRLAWQAMWLNTATTLTPGATNSMKSFSGAHRNNFNNFVNALVPWANTPSHKMVNQVFNYMKTAPGTDSPWADVPGTAQATPYMACRRTYHMFMTDGGWNANNGETVGNADGTAQTLGDGATPYNPASGQVNAYKDAWGGTGVPSTVADIAFASWATDLQPGMANSIQPLIRKSGTEVVGGVNLQEFWNPKNDPATWQHIVTNAIGFGDGASRWTTNNGGALIPPFWDNVTDSNYAGDYPNLVNGTVSWPDTVNGMNENGRPVELWHMALNGRGKFYPARSAAALNAAFADILDNVINDTSKPLVSVASNTSRIRSNTLLYTAGYDGKDWSGYLKAYKVTNAGPAVAADWNAADLLDAMLPTNRVVLSNDGTSGVPFRWNSLPVAGPAIQRTLLDATDSRGSERVDYLRGVRTAEGSAAATFRTRSTVLGDIVNSNIWYLGRPASASRLPGYSAFSAANAARTPMLYIGANDGMLHGLVAATGEEKIAYVPLGAYTNLVNYTAQSYTHKYTVDSSPFSGDVKVGGANPWKTYLAGFMGAGGKGYFVLDVTDPSAASFSETNAASLVVLDNTTPTDADVGNIFAQPSKDPANEARAVQFAMMNNDRPALIIGNGINSANERPVLIIQYLDGAKEIFKLVASAAIGQSNGLSNPQVIDLNYDGKADLVYAGDLLGNLWKFDISAASQASWKVSFGGNPLFSAKDAGGSPQPIVGAPIWVTHPKGGLTLGFGTGRNFTSGDRTDISEQSIYSVWDNSIVTIAANASVTVEDDATKRITTGRTSLVQQTMDTTVVASDAGRSFFTFVPIDVNYNTTGANPNRRGWFMNFTDSGERGASNATFLGGNYVEFPSAVPASGTDSNTETCSLTSKREVGYLTVVDLISGAPSTKPIFDTDGGLFTGSEVAVSKVKNQGGESISFDGGTGSPTGRIIGGSPSTTPLNFRIPGPPERAISWRER